MKTIRLRIPLATWYGILTGTILCLAGAGAYLLSQPSSSHPVALHHHVPKLATPSPSHIPLPSQTPLAALNNLLHNYANPVAGATRLITNEYAFFNQGDHTSVNSQEFEMDSGSLFARDGNYWTGIPDACTPNARSTNCTDSDVFRLDTKASYSGNVAVSLALMQLNPIANPNCNANDTCWYGTHIWMRYQNEYNLYYASVNRADGQMVIKRKVPCGTDNSGTYFVLSEDTPHAFQPGVWNHYRVSIQTNSDSSVTIKLYDIDISTSVPVVTGTDRGGTNPNWSSKCTTPGHYPSANYQPITAPGGIGIRGDYANFVFRDLQVTKFN